MEKKILIVDDEPHIRALLEQTLEDFEDEDVEILTAKNGQEGLEIIQEEQPELVFLDVMMPKMNGFDVCEAVKQKLKLNDVYIVMLTAKGQELDQKRGEEAGADTYMTKPFDPDVILEKAEEVLGIEL
ncbi:MAG: response regulator [bacterium]|nr:response regulator [bacterium]